MSENNQDIINENESLKAQIDKLKQKNEKLEDQNDGLQDRITELEEENGNGRGNGVFEASTTLREVQGDFGILQLHMVGGNKGQTVAGSCQKIALESEKGIKSEIFIGLTAKYEYTQCTS